MIRINLLPYMEKRKEAGLKRQIIILSTAFVVFLLIIVSLHIYTVRGIGKLEKEIEGVEARLKVLTKITGDIEKVKENKEVLKKKLAIIENLEKSRLDPVLFLDDLTTRVPEGRIWLTALSGSGTDLRVEGVARDNTAIADFMKNLEWSQYIRSVDLVSSRQTIISGVKLKEFTLSCTMKKG
ncbi:MAG: PilN domain-containing protein [Proteobacteria bacterium]|nr:PilN domain-containing protein [Pseudomonadota bacterium]